MNDNKIGYVTQRNKEAKVMELVAAVIILITWALAITVVIEQVPNGTMALGYTALDTVLTALIMWSVYKPTLLNINVRNPKWEHYDLTVRFTRVVAILVALLMMGTVLTFLVPRLASGLMAVCGTLVTIALIVYLIKFYRVK